MKVPTACRYFSDWKRLGPNFEPQHAYSKQLIKKTSPDRERTIELCAIACRITTEKFEAILQQPNGLRRLMTEKFYFPAQANADHKRYVALELTFTISNHLVNKGGKFEDVNYALHRWMKENQVYRKQEDAFIQEENRDIQFMRRIIEADLENERRGQVQPEGLSAKEKDAILRWGRQSAVRQMERMYWIRISLIMAEGMTVEQAREKFYQDLVNNGEVESEGCEGVPKYYPSIENWRPAVIINDQTPIAYINLPGKSAKFSTNSPFEIVYWICGYLFASKWPKIHIS